MSIHKVRDGVWKIRWREGGRNRSIRVNGSHELAKKIERKKKSLRDENRHLDIKREVNFRMSALIDRYRDEYVCKKKSADREGSILKGIREELDSLFVREVDGRAVDHWYQTLMTVRGLSAGTAVRHFNVMHHMMEKAATIWSEETGIDRNPADLVEVKRPNDQRERYLAVEEILRLKAALDAKMYRQGSRAINQTFYRLRLLVLLALTTGMRMAEIFGLTWADVRYREGLIVVRAKLKGGRIRYVPMTPELSAEIQRFPAVMGEDRIFPPKRGATGERQRVEGSFETVLDKAEIRDFRFHGLRHTFASWFMMRGGDLYELAKILGHSNVKMLADAQSGDLAHCGDSVRVRTVEQWIAGHLPAALDPLIAEVNAPDLVSPKLADLLAQHKIISLKDAARELEVQPMEVESCARRDPRIFGMLGGTTPSLFQRVQVELSNAE